ncbi:MAG: DUF4253 domain-containing protein [Clostridiales bacterium]|nr:DUF4253 domain-containing protein [Clostridiales bacterium]
MYTQREMEAIETHIETYFGEFTQVWHELVSPDVHVDICIVPPAGDRDYYTLVTMGMGAHRMHVPAELADRKLERAELVIALPADWKLGEHGEEWYWPVRLLKTLARLPGEEDSWLGWGHSVDHTEPFAENTGLCACMLISPQQTLEESQVCLLPDGQEVNFYQVIPLYRDEAAYKVQNGANALLDRLAETSFVVCSDRPDVIAGVLDGQAHNLPVMDGGMGHLENIREKGLLVEEIAAYNHMAVYLRWCMEQGLMSPAFLEKYGELAGRVKSEPSRVDLRTFIRDILKGFLVETLFDDRGRAFSQYYYGDGEDPYFPADIDGYALQYFGPEQYHSPAFQDEAYLFIPFDETYYRAMAKVIQRRWEDWQRKTAAEREPSGLAKALMAYLDCPCQYFPPMKDDGPIAAAFDAARRLGEREGFVPMLVAADETLWECLLINSDPDSEGEDDSTFQMQNVAAYRKAMLARPVQDGRAVLEELGEAGESGEPDEMEGGEAGDALFSYWDYTAQTTLPLILAQIPVRAPWQVFAYLPFGGWNECPDTAGLMAVAKYWYETYGAVPAAMTHDELEFVLSAPVPGEKAMELALEQYAFCPDLDQNPIGALADSLRKSKTWYFWWD